MARLIPPDFGNGKRPSDPAFEPSTEPNAVAVLDVSDETHELVGALHNQALDPDNEDVGLLTGHFVLIDNPAPATTEHGDPSTTRIQIGGSTLHEAATEVLAAVTLEHRNMPAWVASTVPDLAAVLAEHFTVKGYSTCKVRDISEVSA